MKKILMLALVGAAGFLPLDAGAADESPRSPPAGMQRCLNADGMRGPDGCLGRRQRPERTPMFDTLDTDKDGVISTPESDAFRKARFDKMDADRNGKVTPEEFAAMRAAQGRPRGVVSAEDPRVKMRFDLMDADKDGTLTFEELSARSLAAHREADTNADGKVSREEFQARKDKMRAERAARKGGPMMQAPASLQDDPIGDDLGE